MPNLAKIDLKLRDIHRVVDIHCHAIELVDKNIMKSNSNNNNFLDDINFSCILYCRASKVCQYSLK